MSVAGIILAAGFSRRLGRPKQLLEIDGVTLLARAVQTARQAGLHPILVVVPPAANWLAPASDVECRLVENPGAEEGLASSIRLGVRAAAEDEQILGAVLLTCDQILLTPQHLRALCRDLQRVTGSAYAGKAAVPAYFPRASFGQLLALVGDAGARDLLRYADLIPAEELALDIDTEADVARARELLPRKEAGCMPEDVAMTAQELR